MQAVQGVELQEVFTCITVMAHMIRVNRGIHLYFE